MVPDLDSELSFAFHLAKCLLACCFVRNIILAVYQLYLQKFLWKIFLPSLKSLSPTGPVTSKYLCTCTLYALLVFLIFCGIFYIVHICVLNSWCKKLLDDVCNM